MKAVQTTAAGRLFILGVVCALAALTAPMAAAHPGGSKCTGEFELRGNSIEGECHTTFQGFPIGMAGVYDAEPTNTTTPKTKAAEVHIEVMAQMADGAQRPLGVECTQYDAVGEARCRFEYNPVGESVTGPEPMPEEIVAIICKAHSHARFSHNALPAGKFACWSTDESREDLEADGWFEDAGFKGDPDVEPDPEPEPEPGPLAPFQDTAAKGLITTVPINTYLPSTLPVSRSLGLTYVNADILDHDVVAYEAKRPDGSAPWCGTFEDMEDPSAVECPLFWSPLIPSGETTPVLGLQDTKVGESYSFYCSIHPSMRGTIQVVE